MGGCSFRKLDGDEIELLVDYGMERAADSWLERLDDPVMLVTGAGGFIGRYVVDLLVGLGYRVSATDVGRRPRYLGQAKFEQVAYRAADLREEEDVRALMSESGPAAVFHVGAIFDFSAPPDLLWQVNVTGTERVCEAARDAGARRLVYWSTGSMYASSDEPAVESATKAPADPYAESKLTGELAAFAYHDPGRFEVYSVRPAMVSGVLSRYGSGLVMRLVYEGYLVGAPATVGMTTAVVNARDVATCGYLLAARDLDVRGASSDDTAFNAAAEPVEIESMMRRLGEKIPRRHILGVRTKLAEVIGFGYQERVRLPDVLVRTIAQASRLATEALNRVRPARLFPKIPPGTVPYLTRPHPMSSAKARELLGWRPDPVEADFDEIVRYYEETGWTGFERSAASAKEGGAARGVPGGGSASPIQGDEVARAGREARPLVTDEVQELVRALRSETEPYAEPRLRVPSLGLEIDTWSLRTLVRSAEAHILERAYHGRLADVMGGAIPRLLSHAAADVQEYLRSAYQRRYGRGGLPEFEALMLAKSALGLDRDRLVFWIVAANIARVIGQMQSARGQLRRLGRLLPEGTYGLLIETAYGDVAVEYARRPSGSDIHSPREETDTIPRHLPLQERTEHFRRLRGLKLALGVRFRDLVDVFSGRATAREVEKAFTCSPPEVLGRLGRKVEDSGWTLLLLENERGRYEIGIRLGLSGNKVASLLSHVRLKAYRKARDLVPPGRFEETLREASSGRENVKVYPVADFRRLLAEAMTTGIVSRLFGR